MLFVSINTSPPKLSHSTVSSTVTISLSSSSSLWSPSSLLGVLSISPPLSDVTSVRFVKLVPVKSASIVNVKFTVSIAPPAKDETIKTGPAASIILALVPASLETYVKPVGGVSLKVTLVARAVPSFVNLTAKVTELPGLYGPVPVNVLLIAKSYVVVG